MKNDCAHGHFRVKNTRNFSFRENIPRPNIVNRFKSRRPFTSSQSPETDGI